VLYLHFFFKLTNIKNTLQDLRCLKSLKHFCTAYGQDNVFLKVPSFLKSLFRLMFPAQCSNIWLLFLWGYFVIYLRVIEFKLFWMVVTKKRIHTDSHDQCSSVSCVCIADFSPHLHTVRLVNKHCIALKPVYLITGQKIRNNTISPPMLV